MNNLVNQESSAELYWIPLGAGAHIVRFSGKAFEAIAAKIHHRSREKLYHSALQLFTPNGRYTIEQAPVVNKDVSERGVVAEGPVGMRILGGLAIFRYEVRCWKEGNIPDLDTAAGQPTVVTRNEEQIDKILKGIVDVPTPVWGRDELHTGEMWNSNSVISWVLEQSGIDASTFRPPDGGRAPGWQAGIKVAHR
ncbi:MAG TPA: hypothetical protein PK096_04440 [Candidatus Saccharibacteria bacterium]|nr:hypothetical protein [Candidatus Saccharibacteria bacterium]HRK94587.1 hypothetical protein [Candidatus Saccharibacteria bacterium]